MPHSHRSSSLKQSNKKNKTGKASKRSINRSQGGKVQNRAGIKKSSGSDGTGSSKAKANRMHMAKQRRDASKDKLWQQRRVQGRLNVRNSDATIVTRVVGIISLSDEEIDLENIVKDFLVDAADKKQGSEDGSAAVNTTFSKYKKEGHVTFLTNTTAFRALYKDECVNPDDASVQAALDLSRVCDTVVFLLDGRDADKNGKGQVPITGMNIGDGASTTTTATRVQQDFDHLVSARGDRILSAIKAQGLPTPLTLLVNFEGGDDEETMSLSSLQSIKSIRRSALKKKLELKKYLSRFAATEFGEGSCKVMEIYLPSHDNDEEDMKEDEKNTLIIGNSKKILPDALLNTTDEYPTRAAFIRTICTMHASPPKWVSNMPRAFILSNNNTANGAISYDEATKELKITGFVRGKVPFDVNGLAHVPNVGTFGVKEIIMSESPTLQRRKGAPQTEDETSNVLAKCDVTQREPFDMYANPDALDGEQNLIGFDEDGHEYNDDNGMANKKEDEVFARPAGWNDYQSAWLDALKDDGMLSDDGIDHGELAAELNKKKTDPSLITGMEMDAEDDKYVSAEERQALIAQRKKDKLEDLQFPDEVQVEEEENARDRLARYRSLKSFKQSFWDPKENLPETYASIFHFGSFRATQADIMSDMKDIMQATEEQFQDIVDKSKAKKDGDEAMGDGDVSDDSEGDLLEGCVASGTFVTLVLEGVSSAAAARIDPAALLTVVGLLPHENKVSVLHMGLSETSQCDEFAAGDMPVKSKDVITFRCGWRTWQAKPVFSQNNLNCDKHKYERFMPTQGCFFASSVLGPVTYTPCPVLAFRKASAGNMQFVALGSMLGADADRIVVKRIVLTGYPTRVHKRHATVKYMFYNPDDVKWFKPAELVTKHGLQGNIVDSVGDHGTMKCLFNAPIKQHDTVCINLYKRIYPKFAPVEIINEKGEKVKENILIL